MDSSMDSSSSDVDTALSTGFSIYRDTLDIAARLDLIRTPSEASRSDVSTAYEASLTGEESLLSSSDISIYDDEPDPMEETPVEIPLSRYKTVLDIPEAMDTVIPSMDVEMDMQEEEAELSIYSVQPSETEVTMGED